MKRDDEIAIVRALLQHYATRGAFRSFSEVAGNGRTAEFHFLWFRDVKFRVMFNPVSRTLTFVDVATQSVVNTVPNAGMLGVAVDETTHHVYAASQTSVSMVDGVTGAVLHTASAGPGDSWWAVGLDTGTRRVYVTNLDPSAPSLVILAADDLSFLGEVALPEVPRLALAVDVARQLVS